MISTGVIFCTEQLVSFKRRKGGIWAAWSNLDRVSESDGGISSVDPSTGKLTGVITDYDLAENCLQGQTGI